MKQQRTTPAWFVGGETTKARPMGCCRGRSGDTAKSTIEDRQVVANSPIWSRRFPKGILDITRLTSCENVPAGTDTLKTG